MRIEARLCRGGRVSRLRSYHSCAPTQTADGWSGRGAVVSECRRVTVREGRCGIDVSRDTPAIATSRVGRWSCTAAPAVQRNAAGVASEWAGSVTTSVCSEFHALRDPPPLLVGGAVSVSRRKWTFGAWCRGDPWSRVPTRGASVFETEVYASGILTRAPADGELAMRVESRQSALGPRIASCAAAVGWMHSVSRETPCTSAHRIARVRSTLLIGELGSTVRPDGDDDAPDARRSDRSADAPRTTVSRR